MATEYVTLTEYNEHEGETWHFYIPIEGNEQAIEQLGKALGAFAAYWEAQGVVEDPPFELNTEPLVGSEVATLVKHTDSGCMAYHNQLEGRLDIPGAALVILSSGDPDPLYKGRISDYMKSA